MTQNHSQACSTHEENLIKQATRMGSYTDLDCSLCTYKLCNHGSNEDIVKQQISNGKDLLDDFFKFVSKDNMRTVVVVKTVQGLGLSVTGGLTVSDGSRDAGSNCSWSGLIRIKKIYLHGAAWQTGQLAVGDVLLSANGQPLTGCTDYEALEILRCTPRETQLVVCRVPQDVAEKMGLISHEMPTLYSSSRRIELTPELTLTNIGEFEIVMTKVNGSLGFTLRREDDSVLGHYVRSLVKEPAISDGRICPGDKIISVNGVDMSSMTHSEAVAFLRRCPDTVTIRLFRDSATTPISPLSPVEPETSLNRPRPLLRQEAQDLLHDLALRKQSSSRGGSPCPTKLESPCSPRRRRYTKTPSPISTSLTMKERLTPPADESADSLVTARLSPIMAMPKLLITAHNDELSVRNSTGRESFSGLAHSPSQVSRSSRPDFLDLNNSFVKKQRFMFSPRNLATPTSNESKHEDDGTPYHSVEEVSSHYDTPELRSPESLPALSKSADELPRLFQSQIDAVDEQERNNEDRASNGSADFGFMSFDSSPKVDDFDLHELSDQGDDQGDDDDDGDEEYDRRPDIMETGNTLGKDSLVKWKGIVLSPDEEYDNESRLGVVQTVELNKGWNSRLGFSIGEGASSGQFVITAIYNDSVAAKDGRLKVGDRVLKVNGERLDGCSKDYVIDLLRRARGQVAITILKE